MKKNIMVMMLFVLLVSCAQQTELAEQSKEESELSDESLIHESESMHDFVEDEQSSQEQLTSDKEEKQSSSVVDVSIENFAFNPTVITIKQGQSIRWTNKDGVMHTATGSNGEFDTGPLQKGESKEIVFNEKGEFKYICTPHPNMRGKVIVE